jgi:spermidine synthase
VSARNATSRPRLPVATLLAVGLLSAAMLSFELTLTRLFAVAQFYHFAFMVISLALLGLGAAGSLLSVWPSLGEHPARWAVGFALATLVSYAILNLIPFDSYAIAWDRRQALYLVLTFSGAALPFVFGGLVVGGLLAADVRGLHRVYAANLAGSALGCVVVLPLLGWLGGEGALFAGAALGLVGAGLFGVGRADGRRRFGELAGIVAGIVVLIVLAITRPEWAAIRLSPYKGLHQALLAPTADHTISEWGIVARVDVVESDSIHIMPGLSQNAPIAYPPRQAGLTLDGDNLMPVTALAPEDELARTLAANVPQAVVIALRPAPASVLILEPGGGWDVLLALAGGAESVMVVERSPLVVSVLRDDYADFTRRLYDDPRVMVVVAEGRTYVRRTERRFDVIILSLSDSFHPVTSGAYSLSEDYRYTVEAVGDALDHLAPGGVLVMMRWLQTPPTESLRALGTVEAALRARDVERPADHIAALRGMRTMTFVVGEQPLGAADREVIRAFAASRGYDLVWLPGISPDEVNLRSRLPEPAYYLAFAALLDDPVGFVRGHEFDIRPPTDDRPFFFHYFRWRQTPRVLAELGHTWQPFGGSGYFVLVALLILVTILAALAIFGPLVAGRVPAPEPRPRRRGVRVRALAYFFALGLAFLFVEIPLAQRFILFLGQPVTALSVVLFAILLFSGVGSLSAPRWSIRVALGALVIAVLLTPLALRGVFALALGWPLAARVAVAILSLAPMGVLMGVPFARGMALVEEAAPGLTPWAWAINGSASVISGVLAVMAALSWGFSVVLWLGAGTYALALVAIGGMDTAPGG